jgi:gluconolactonase
MWRIAALSFLLLFRASLVASVDQVPGTDLRQHAGVPQLEKQQKFTDGGVGSILAAGNDWTLLGQGYQLTADSAVDKEGSVYFTDARKNRILKIDPNGRISVWKEASGGAHGIAAGPDRRLYAGQQARKRIVALDLGGNESVVAEGVQTHHLIVTKRSGVYFADAPNHTVWLVDAAGRKRAVTTDVNWPHGLRLSTDQSRLFVTDSHIRWVWSFKIQPDGSLANGQRFCRLETRNESPEVDAGGMTFDTEGFLYVGTSLGVQVFDRTGRLTVILDAPGTGGVSNVFFGGPSMEWLYVTDGDKIYRRLSKRRGTMA